MTDDDLQHRQDEAYRLFEQFIRHVEIPPTHKSFLPSHKNRDVICSAVWHVRNFWTVSVDMIVRPGERSLPHYIFRVRDDKVIGPVTIGGPEEAVVRRLVAITTKLLISGLTTQSDDETLS